VEQHQTDKIENIEIERVTLDGLLQLQDIGRQTFFETFSESNSEENMKKYLDDSFDLGKLTHEIENANSEIYFAIVNQKVVGYIKINFADAQTEMNVENTLELERIYVLKEFHGKRIGQILFDRALQIAKQKEFEYLWLGVWEENHRALNFYAKNGFTSFDKHAFLLGDDLQTDIMMKLPIS
jgi:ribosomal protein S18 acetylase RimI-like enzyme